MFRCSKYKKRLIVAEGVAITQTTVEKAEKQAETQEEKKDEAEIKMKQKKLFKAWRGF